MSGYQFLHIETYGTVVSEAKLKAKARKKTQTDTPLSVQQVIDEALRRPGNCDHVAKPQRPIEHFSTIPLGQLAAEVMRRKEASTDLIGRAVRKDALCMIGGVASFPVPIAAMQEKDWVDFEDFLNYTERFLKRRFGKALVNMTTHVDEKHPHVHFYCIPESGEGLFTLIGLHPGVTAKERVGKAVKGGSKELTKKRNKAYVEAMRKFQDDFYRDVASHSGMQRFGPKRSRMSRAEWQTIQHQVKVEGLKSLADENEQLKERATTLEKKVWELQQSLTRSHVTPE